MAELDLNLAKASHPMNICYLSSFCYPGVRVKVTAYILIRKSFATLTNLLVPFFGPKQSLSDKAIDKSLYLPCIQHKNQNGVAYDNNSKATPNFKVTWLQYFTLCEKSFFNQYLFSKAEWMTNSNQVNLCLCQSSLRVRDVFNF